MKDNNRMQIVVILVIILAILVGVYFWMNNKFPSSESEKLSEVEKIKKTIEQIKPPQEISQDTDFQQAKMKDFTNQDHNITGKYPADWQEADLGGDKNVATPLTRENIGFFYLPDSEVSQKDPATSIVSVKLLRFVLEEDVKIKSHDDWYDYIKAKVDEFIANPTLSSSYQLINLSKGEKIDNKWTVVEDYIENDLVIGKDFYIFNQDEFYQFVTKAPKDYFSKFLPLIEETVNSFKIGK